MHTAGEYRCDIDRATASTPLRVREAESGDILRGEEVIVSPYAVDGRLGRRYDIPVYVRLLCHSLLDDDLLEKLREGSNGKEILGCRFHCEEVA